MKGEDFLRINVGFPSALFMAALIHIFLFSIFVFTFKQPQASFSPAFIFLGSFLRSQDVALSSSGKEENQEAVLNIGEVQLDIRATTLSRELDKPQLIEKAAQPVKRQYKPSMADTQSPSLSPTDTSDLGIDLEEILPVKLRISQ